MNLTVPLATIMDLADRPGDLSGFGPVDPWLARDLARAAAGNPKTTWCVTVTDADGHAIGHDCARPQPKNRSRPSKRGEGGKRDGPGSPDETGNPERPGPGFAFTRTSRDGPPGGYGTWTLSVPGPGSNLTAELHPLTTENCDHRFEAQGHDPGVKLRHLAQIRHATCTSPICRRPAATCDYEHNTPYETGGRTCLCNGGPKCRRDHRLKQHPRWKVEQHADGSFTWTTPSGRAYTTEPTRYPTLGTHLVRSSPISSMPPGYTSGLKHCSGNFPYSVWCHDVEGPWSGLPVGGRVAHQAEDVRVGLADLRWARPTQRDHRLLVVVTLRTAR